MCRQGGLASYGRSLLRAGGHLWTTSQVRPRATWRTLDLKGPLMKVAQFLTTIPDALAIALQHHQAGRLQLAEEIYRQILSVEPNHAGTWHLLGVVAHEVGRHEAAVECIERAIQLQGNEATFHSNLGEAYRALRKLPEAVACFRRALQLRPDMAGSIITLGTP